MYWLAHKFEQPVYAWYQQHVAAPSAQDLVWHVPAGPSPGQSGLPLDKHFRSAEVVALRGSWEDTNSVFVALKGGDNKANHSHLDLGNFVLDSQGVRWAMDLGAENYNLPGYFGAKRWTYYRLRAEGQNTLVIDPGDGPDQDPRAAAPITRFESKAERAFAITDLTMAYPKSAKRVQRGIALIHRRQVMIQDEVETLAPAEVWWFLHTRAAAKPSEDGRSVILEQGNAKLHARLLAPEEARFEVLDALPLPTSPQPEGQSRNEGIRKLSIHLKNLTHSRITVILTPEAEPKEQGTRTFQPLSDW
jgi:hypothetical protein